MPRARSPNREKARELWLRSGKKRKLSDIAAELHISAELVRNWKCRDRWDAETGKYENYDRIYWDSIDEDEREMLAGFEYNEERLIQEQIALLAIRERRLMRSIDGFRQREMSVESVSERYSEKDGDGQTQITTKSVSSLQLLGQLESELTRVQTRKTHCIEALSKLREEQTDTKTPASAITIYIPSNGRDDS